MPARRQQDASRLVVSHLSLSHASASDWKQHRHLAEDYQRVNGFDENYVGWGLEDRDLQLRLSRLGLRFNSILSKTAAYHMWHPTDPTFARNNNGTANLRHDQERRVTRCRNGLKKRKLSELAIRVVGDAAAYPRMEKLLRRLRITSGHAEVEILFMSDSSRFSGMAEINVLIRPLEEAAGHAPAPAHLVIATDYVPDIIDVLPFPSSDAERGSGGVPRESYGVPVRRQFLA